MSFPFYKSEGLSQKPAPAKLPVPQRERLQDPAGYLADEGLADAANVALLLNQPLLLTGEAGTGKTVFAYSLAWQLGGLPVYKFETKSSSAAQDLFYSYDALKRFQHAQSAARREAADPLEDEGALPYITYRALGAAILGTYTPEKMAAYLPKGASLPAQTRAVVLIDEIDKAPRDFPNDMLNELELMYFRIPELDNAEIRADPALQPVVVITSNSEKDLPPAFLRRCVYYNISFPPPERLKEILANRLGLNAAGSSDFVDMALDLFKHLRESSSGLSKLPATAELLGFMLALRQMAPGVENPLADPALAERAMSSLIKSAEDQKRAKDLVNAWAKTLPPQASGPAQS